MTTKWEAMAVREYVRNDGSKGSNWTRVGVGFTNRDGSINVQLDAVPLDGKIVLQIPLTQEQRQAKQAQRNQGGGGGWSQQAPQAPQGQQGGQQWQQRPQQSQRPQGNAQRYNNPMPNQGNMFAGQQPPPYPAQPQAPQAPYPETWNQHDEPHGEGGYTEGGGGGGEPFPQ